MVVTRSPFRKEDWGDGMPFLSVRKSSWNPHGWWPAKKKTKWAAAVAKLAAFFMEGPAQQRGRGFRIGALNSVPHSLAGVQQDRWKDFKGPCSPSITRPAGSTHPNTPAQRISHWLTHPAKMHISGQLQALSEIATGRPGQLCSQA